MDDRLLWKMRNLILYNFYLIIFGGTVERYVEFLFLIHYSVYSNTPCIYIFENTDIMSRPLKFFITFVSTNSKLQIFVFSNHFKCYQYSTRAWTLRVIICHHKNVVFGQFQPNNDWNKWPINSWHLDLTKKYIQYKQTQQFTIN